MKKKSILYLLLLVLLSLSLTPLQAEDSTVAKQMQPLKDSLFKKLDAVQSSVNGKIDSLKNEDSASTAAVNASFSKALETWKKNKKEHYRHTFGSFNLLFFLSFGVMLIICLLLITQTAICRDESYDPQTQLLKKDLSKRPFSYSKVQCLFWTLIIFSCYTALSIYFLDLIPLNGTVIVLLGGGLSVAVFGKIIDTTQVKDDGEAYIRHQDVNNSAGFFTDIVSDDTGVSVHRLQAFLFNVLFGAGFIMTCIANVKNLEYPFADYEIWQFTLLGISAAGYLGMKTAENGKSTEKERSAKASDTANSNDEDGAETATRARDEKNYQ